MGGEEERLGGGASQKRAEAMRTEPVREARSQSRDTGLRWGQSAGTPGGGTFQAEEEPVQRPWGGQVGPGGAQGWWGPSEQKMEGAGFAEGTRSGTSAARSSTATPISRVSDRRLSKHSTCGSEKTLPGGTISRSPRANSAMSLQLAGDEGRQEKLTFIT